MSIRIAESAGFCFGVSRAVETVEQAAGAGKQVVTLGPIITTAMWYRNSMIWASV